MKLICLLLFIALSNGLRHDWVDPHDMNTNDKQKLKRYFSENDKAPDITKGASIQNEQLLVTENTSLIYLKRIINIILKSATSGKDNPSVFTGSYHYVLDTQEHKFLVEFGNKDSINIEDIRQLDIVLSTLFSKQYEYDIFNFNLGITKEQVLTTLFDTKVLILIATCVGLLVMFVLLKNNYGFFYLISYFASVIIIVDYGFRYKSLSEEAEEHNNKITYTSDCDTNMMDWAQYLLFVLSKKDCEKRIVTPLDVSLNQLKYIIIIPLESIGTGFGKFGSELWEKLPFPWNIIVFPMMLVFLLSICFIFVLAFKDTNFKIKLFHLLHLEFGNSNDGGIRITGKTVEKIIDVTNHRNFIEDTTRQTPSKKQKAAITKGAPKKKDDEDTKTTKINKSKHFKPSNSINNSDKGINKDDKQKINQTSDSDVNLESLNAKHDN